MAPKMIVAALAVKKSMLARGIEPRLAGKKSGAVAMSATEPF